MSAIPAGFERWNPSMRGVFKKGAIAFGAGADLAACPYRDNRKQDGRLTWSRAYIAAWEDGWRWASGGGDPLALPVVSRKKKAEQGSIHEQDHLETKGMFIVLSRSNSGDDLETKAESLEEAEAAAMQLRIASNHMVCIDEAGGVRLKRWDRQRYTGENRWALVDPDEMETLGAIREMRRL